MKSKYAVRLHPAAYRDLDGIYQYIYRTPGLPEEASRWLEDLEEGILGLANHPFRWPEDAGSPTVSGYRELPAGPFLVLYKICRESRQVEVVAVRYRERDREDCR